ncbi:MAG TPA: TIM-barrel domain-containing protein [Anaerolineales bacterium]|nr:TIM-barrel domain-containing protein [Anaerolineales bacterium]
MSLPPVPSFKPIANLKSIVVAPNVRFTVLTDRIIRIEFSQVSHFEDRPSQVFWYRDQPVPKFKKEITDKVIEIETNYLHLIYKIGRTGFTPRNLSIKIKNGKTIWRFGASAAKAGNLKGTARTLDGVAGKTRLEDGLVSTAGWSVVDDSKTLVFDENGWLVPRTNRKSLDLYFFGYGDDIPGMLRDYTRIAGEIPMIPRYILGNWWSRYWAYTQEELQSLMQEFRAREIPLSVCIIDMDWHLTKTGNQSPGWTGYTWNRELFPDPQGFIAWLHSQGLRTALNLHPADGVHSHEEQYAEMAKWMGIDPNSKTPVAFDISDPRFMEGYFELLHHPFETPASVRAGQRAKRVGEARNGVDFWWMDWQQGKSSRVKGLDPLWGLNHLHFQDIGRNGRNRPFVFSRWGGLGNHRYPIGFSGDTIIEWSSLAFQPYFTSTAANVAYGWWSHDIGGHFRVDGTPELYLRWVQFGVFSPIFRLHSSNMPELDRRPWGNKPERIFQAAREAMQLRHALIPYVYSMAWRAHQTGLSLVTPMYYGNMDSSEAHKAKDQYFFGSELIVAPVVKPVNEKTGFTTQKIWFPRGTWFNFFTGEQIKGGSWQTVKSTLEDIPVYAKAGAIIPLAPKVGWGGIENPNELDIYVFPGKDNAFDLYEDDGETTDYQRGKYAITTFTLKKNTFTIQPVTGDTSLTPSQRIYRIHLRGVEEKTRVSLPGQYDASTRTLILDVVTLQPTESLQVKLKR